MSTLPVTQVPTTAGGRTVLVAVVEADPNRRIAITAKAGDAADKTSSRSISRIERTPGQPTVVVFGQSFATTDGLAQITTFLASDRSVVGILVAEDASPALLKAAMRAGVADVVEGPDGLGELEDVVRASAARLGDVERRGESIGGGGGGGQPGKVICVFGTKGGCGKSVVATNLAIALARTSSQPVSLIDADLQFGDAAVMLKLTPTHTITDVVTAIDRLEPVLAPSFFVRHEPSGVLVLPAPTEPVLADQISAQDAARIVTMARGFCSHVIVDTPGYFTDVVLSILDVADEIVLVAGMDVPNIKNVKLGLNTMKALDVPDSKIKVVLNRTRSKAKMHVGDVEKVLGWKAVALIPSDIVVPQSINEGVPVMLSAPKSDVAKSVDQLAALVRRPDRRRAAR